jgi:uroporphyrinogen-III decarboxylase
MNAKERVRAVLEGKQPDRVPLGFYIVDHDTIAKVIGRNTYVRNKIGQQIAFWEGRRDEVAESLKKDTVEFFSRIPLCDIVTAKEAALLPAKDYQPPKVRKVDEKTWEDERGRIYKISELSNEFVCIEDPVAASREYTPADFPEDVEPQPQDESRFEAFDYLLQHLGSERFILGPGELTAMPLIGGMERGLMDYVVNPDLIRAAIRHDVKIGNAHDVQMIRPGQDGVLFEEDYGTSLAPLISPAMFRDFSFPALKSRIGNIKHHGQWAFLHSCGHTWPLLDMFVEAGLDCYQSLQTGAGMDIDRLQSRYRGRLTFWGGIAIETLISDTPAAVRQDVRRAVSVAKNGGIIIGPSHSIAYGVPYDNFMAMLDEFDKNAAY